VHAGEVVEGAAVRAREPGELRPGQVARLEASVRGRHPQTQRHDIGQRAQALLALALEADALGVPQELLLPANGLPAQVELDKHADLASQDVGIEGFEEVVDGAVLVALERVRLIGVERGHEDDRHVRAALPRLDEVRGLVAVQAGHPDVHEDDGKVLVQRVTQGLVARQGGNDALAERLQDGPHAHDVGRVIIDDEHACAQHDKVLRQAPADVNGRVDRPVLVLTCFVLMSISVPVELPSAQGEAFHYLGTDLRIGLSIGGLDR
jgi:hypothetical protein